MAEGGWDENLFMSKKVSVTYLFVTFFLIFIYIPTLYFVDYIILTNFMVTSWNRALFEKLILI